MDKRGHDYYLHCGIFPKWHNVELDSYTNDLRAKKIVGKYIKDTPKGVGLYLYGANGTGKSYLHHVVMKEMIRRKQVVYVCTPADIIKAYTATWKGDYTLIDRLKKSTYLGIEDLSKEFRGGANSEGSKLAPTALDEVLRFRSQMLLPTIITSNIEPTDIEVYYSIDIASLLREMCRPVQVLGGDYRKIIAKGIKELL